MGNTSRPLLADGDREETARIKKLFVLTISDAEWANAFESPKKYCLADSDRRFALSELDERVIRFAVIVCYPIRSATASTPGFATAAAEFDRECRSTVFDGVRGRKLTWRVT